MTVYRISSAARNGGSPIGRPPRHLCAEYSRPANPQFNAAARARVVENFTWEKAAARLIEILEEIEALQESRCGFRHAAITRLWPFNWPLQ